MLDKFKFCHLFFLKFFEFFFVISHLKYPISNLQAEPLVNFFNDLIRFHHLIIFNWCFENNVSNFVFIFCNYVPWIFTLTRIDLLSQKKKTRIDLYWVLKNGDVMYGKLFVYYRSYGSNESHCSRCKKFYILQSNWPKLSNFFILFLSLHIHKWSYKRKY